ncbi:MAG: hypothetical protein QOH62_754 [Solirubrobacteraceae bacterium]|nr:hypothetical protein [Solirubrobacteraceae bacterium]
MPVATPPPPVAHVAAASNFDRAVVGEINAARAYVGQRPVVLTARLRSLAKHHTLDMLRTNSFSHDGDGTSFATRIQRSVNYKKVGETLALMPRNTSARRVVSAWLKSPGHRAVLLDPSYRRIGIGGANGSMGHGSSFAVTADFATWR